MTSSTPIPRVFLITASVNSSSMAMGRAIERKTERTCALSSASVSLMDDGGSDLTLATALASKAPVLRSMECSHGSS